MEQNYFWKQGKIYKFCFTNVGEQEMNKKVIEMFNNEYINIVEKSGVE